MKSQRWWIVAVTGVVLLIVIIGVVAYVALHHGTDSPQPKNQNETQVNFDRQGEATVDATTDQERSAQLELDYIMTAEAGDWRPELVVATQKRLVQARTDKDYLNQERLLGALDRAQQDGQEINNTELGIDEAYRAAAWQEVRAYHESLEEGTR